MRPRIAWLLGTCGLLGLVNAAPALALDLSPLIAVKAEMTLRLVKTDRWHETLFVARDGTSTGSLAFKHSFSRGRRTSRPLRRPRREWRSWRRR